MAYFVKKPDKKQSIKSANADGPVTFEKFYDMVEENIKADLLDGNIIRDSPAIPKHGRIVSWCDKVLGLFAEELDLGEVFVATTTVRLSKYQGPEPDFFYP
jgi:Uma2 family endonuclease